MEQWFRSWHGAPTDPKWLAIASRTQTNAGTVSAVVWALFDHASQAEPRGSVADFDIETYAAFSGFEVLVVHGIIEALKDKKLIVDGQLSAWSKRQPKREDGSAERSKEWRERKRTQTNETERGRTQIREEEIREEKKEDAAPSAPPEESAEVDLFRHGKKILGAKAGGLIKNLVSAKGGNVALARAALETASTKADPREYLGAVIRGRDSPEDLRARGEAW